LAKDNERVRREIRILEKIKHPNIVELYEIIETPIAIYMIMEYAAGGELFDYIVEKRRLPEPEAAKLFYQLVCGIEYLHKQQVAHRDLKPENLLLDKHRTTVKIVDFGLSNTYTAKAKLKTACGSPCYAAPEMVAGQNYDPQSVDIWSSGVTLYAMICGYLPFEHPDTAILYRKILKGEFEIPSFLSIEAV
jgi:5'-AMP-activated protein kinase, catalytic alpha subunit